MQTSIDLSAPKFDVFFVSSLLLAGKAVELYNTGSKDNIEGWLKQSVLLILIFVVYDLVISGTVVDMISKRKDSASKELLASINDILKFGAVLASNQLVASKLFNTELSGMDWLLKIAGIVLGYSIFNMASPYLLKVGANYQLIYNDFLKIGLGDIVGNLLYKKGKLDKSDLVVLLVDFIGIVTFHIGIKPIVGINKDDGASVIPPEFASKSEKYRM